ncbi:MAG: hypothetical protein KC912_24985, partial [Proteobacteria bacterium]|nr:hypothetical protein [Pseudomonadota bacterium]
WLAAFSREWSWALGSSSPSTATTDFEEGGPRRRLAALVELRQVDADKARETLKGIWPGLAAEQRLSLLQGLNSELGALDEPFLVELARDRSKRVQQAAAGLLARIPQSALSQRMVHRARASLGETLELPAAFGEDWAADGLVERPPRGIGERAWWLRQILAHCDLGALAGADINAWLATLPVDAPQVWLGVAEAAVRGRDPVWAERILDRLPATLDPQLRLALLGLTQPRAREQRVLRMMRANDALALRAVEVLDAPWSRRFSLQYLNHVATQAGHTPQGSHHQAWAATLRTAARAIPASCFAQAVSLHIPEGGGHHLWLRRRDDFLGILHFRKAFAGELSASIPGSSDD